MRSLDSSVHLILPVLPFYCITFFFQIRFILNVLEVIGSNLNRILVVPQNLGVLGSIVGEALCYKPGYKFSSQ
jgi:hypothetical protein